MASAHGTLSDAHYDSAPNEHNKPQSGKRAKLRSLFGLDLLVSGRVLTAGAGRSRRRGRTAADLSGWDIARSEARVTHGEGPFVPRTFCHESCENNQKLAG